MRTGARNSCTIAIVTVALAVVGPLGNGYYDVFVDDSSGIGQFAARTGVNHPVTIQTGSGQNVIFGGQDGSPGTSFMTIRSYTSQTDYVDRGAGANSSMTVLPLDPFGAVSDIGTTGARTTWTLPGGETSPDKLTVVQDVNVSGTTADNSVIGVTTTITNNGDAAVQLGVRYLWDWQIGDDDGPTFKPISPDGSTYLTEQTFNSPAFTAYAIQDNDSQDSPLFVVYGTAAGPSTLSPRPIAPDKLMFVSWPDAVGQAFDYTTNSSLDVASSEGDVDDSATLYFWGPDSDHALQVAPGDSVTVSASLFAGVPGAPPPIINTPQPTVHHRNTPTPTLTPTKTPVPPTATSMPVVVVAPTATPSGGVGPQVVAPLTGTGSSGGGSLLLAPIALAAALGATALAGATCLRRISSRRS